VLELLDDELAGERLELVVASGADQLLKLGAVFLDRGVHRALDACLERRRREAGHRCIMTPPTPR
jgi:hypothetical protein